MVNRDGIDEGKLLATRLAELPLLDAMQLAFEPLLLHRPLALFGKALGLQPGIADRPDADFLVHILEGVGHRQILRKLAGEQFRNLEHFLRGTHAPTGPTRKLLLLKLGVDGPTLESFAHGRRDGPLLPVYVGMFQALEGTFTRAYRKATVGTVFCPHCGADALDDAHRWWESRTPRLTPDAYEFIDRLLQALLGAVMLLNGIAALIPSAHLDAALLEQLARPDQHPIGHWMTLARNARKLQHDWQLTVGLDAKQPEPAADGRVRKWRSGQDLLPIEKARSMIAGTTQAQVLMQGLLAARTLAFAIDVMRAAAPFAARPSRASVQEILHARLKQLGLHMLHGGTALARRHSHATNRSD